MRSRPPGKGRGWVVGNEAVFRGPNSSTKCSNMLPRLCWGVGGRARPSVVLEHRQLCCPAEFGFGCGSGRLSRRPSTLPARKRGWHNCRPRVGVCVCVCVRPVPPVGLFGLPVAAVGSVASSRIARPGARPRAGQWVSVGAVRHRRTAPRLSSRGRGVSDWMHDVASPDGGGRAVRVAVSVPRSRALDCTRGTAVGRGASPFVVVRRAAGEAPTPRGAPASREADVKVFGGSALFSAPTHIESVRMSLRRPRSRDGGGLLCKGGERLPAGSLALLSVTWLILPVVICLSQRLSHACLSMNASYCETANGSLNQL